MKRLLFAGVLAAALTSCPQPPTPTPNFDLGLSQSELNLEPFSSGKVTVSVANVTALTDAITLSLVDAPSGITGSFQPSKVTSGSSELTLTVGNVAPGVLDLKLRGSSGAVSKDAPLKLTVAPITQSTFALRLEPNKVNLEQGERADLKVTAERFNGFAEPVSFEVSGLPTGVTLEAIPSGDGTTAQFTLIATPNAPLTPTPVIATVTGRSGDVEKIVTLEVNVVASASNFELVPVEPVQLHRNLSKSVTFKVVRFGGFANPITLSFDALPSGVEVLGIDPIGLNNDDEVIFKASNNAVSPTTITVTASSQNGITRTTTVQLEVIDPLDATFGDGGVVTQDVSDLDEIRALAVLPDGNIAISGVGNANQAMLAQFNAIGKFIADRLFTNVNEINALLLDGSNQLVGTGLSKIGAGNSNFALTKSLVNSIDPDNAFNNDGQTAVDFGSSENAAAITRDTNGKYIVAGIGARATGDFDFAVARFNPDGTLDATFSPGTNNGDSDAAGVALVDFGSSGNRFDRALDVAVQPDGKIVVVGFTSDKVDATLKPVATQPAKTLTAISRFNPDGSLDTSFDADGKKTLGFDETNENNDQLGLRVRFQSIAGTVSGITVVNTRFKARVIVHTELNANGTEVASFTQSFGVDGLDTEEINTVLFTDVAEKYYVIGSGRVSASGNLNGVFVTRFVATNTNFVKDSSFGIDGTHVFALPDTSLNARAALLQNDRILVGGFSDRNGTRDALLLRFLR